MGKLFGTDGIRGIAGQTLTAELAFHVGQAVAAVLTEKKGSRPLVTIGKDTRISSDMLEAALMAGICSVGGDVMPLGTIPTPAVAFLTVQQRADAGIVISASHNPYAYNGIKVFTAGGRDADQVVTGKIEEQIALLKPEDVKSIDYDQAMEMGLIREGYPFNEYIDSILQVVDTKKIKRAHLRIAIDPMYGVSQSSLRTILLTCRCDVDVIHEQHDTLFGGKMPAPSADTLKLLSNYVVDNGCNLGVATDGDADRLGVIDNEGQFIHPNKLLVLLYYYLVKYRGWHGPCVRNNSTSHLLDRVAAGLGEKCYEVPVGFKWVSAKMTETDAVIGGESSGGMAVRGHISGKDGIYAAALLVEMLAVTGKSVSALFAEIAAQYGDPQWAEADFRMTPARKAELQERLFVRQETPDFGAAVDHVSREDGCKVYFADGSWVICRFSGTEPLLRMAAEADTQDEAERYIRVWRDFLKL